MLEKCRYHSDRLASGTCVECRSPICGECTELVAGREVCKPCLAKQRTTSSAIPMNAPSSSSIPMAAPRQTPQVGMPPPPDYQSAPSSTAPPIAPLNGPPPVAPLNMPVGYMPPAGAPPPPSYAPSPQSPPFDLTGNPIAQPQQPAPGAYLPPPGATFAPPGGYSIPGQPNAVPPPAAYPGAYPSAQGGYAAYPVASVPVKEPNVAVGAAVAIGMAILCGVIYGFASAAIGMRIPFLALGIGYLMGYAILKATGAPSHAMGIVSAVCTLISCLIGLGIMWISGVFLSPLSLLIVGYAVVRAYKIASG